MGTCAVSVPGDEASVASALCPNQPFLKLDGITDSAHTSITYMYAIGVEILAYIGTIHAKTLGKSF